MYTRSHFLTLVILILLLFSCPILSAQQQIKGAVLDENKTALSFASVMLLQAADSSLVKGDITDEGGLFLLEAIEPGNYRLGLSMIGYLDYFSEEFSISELEETLDLGTISLANASLMLDAVEVTARKPLFEQRIDRLVVNVAQSITSAGSTALDVLERSPGVIVNRQTEAISMAGKDGIVVMVNNKINRMPISALIQMLEGMPSDNIEKIELITTPPANFDAEGNAGIINIILKKNLEEGLNGSFSLTGGYGFNEKYGANTNFNFRKGGVNLFGDYGYNFNHTAQQFTNYRSVTQNGIQLENDNVSDRDPTTATQNARLGIDIDLGDKTVLGFLGSWGVRDWNMDAVNTVKLFENRLLQERILIETIENNLWENYLANINLQHQFSEKTRLTFDLDYAYYINDNPTDYINAFFDSENTRQETTQTRVSKETPIDIWVAKTDLTHSFSEKLNMELGAKLTSSKFKNDFGVENLNMGVWETDTRYTAEYTLDESINALYSSFSWQITPKTGFKAGLRYEYTDSNLGSLTEPDIVDRQYGNLFPSLFLSQVVGENKELQLSYSRRINRPAYTQLAPFVIFLDPTTLISGNEALQPAFTDAITLNYRIKSLFISMGYSFTDNAIAGFQPSIDPETNLQVNQPINQDNSRGANVNVSFPLQVSDWWSMRNNLIGFWQENNATIDGVGLSVARTTFRANTTQSFQLPWAINLELTAYYMSATSWGLVISEPVGDMNIGLQKTFGNSNFRLNLQNVFIGGNWESSTNQPELNLVYRGRYGFMERTLRLTYTRSFGNNKVKAARRRSTGSEAERQRVNQ